MDTVVAGGVRSGCECAAYLATLALPAIPGALTHLSPFGQRRGHDIVRSFSKHTQSCRDE